MIGTQSSWLALAPALLLAGGAGAAPVVPASAGGGTSRVRISEVLQPGTEMQGMIVPRYDKQLKLSSVLHAELVTLVEGGSLEGEKIDVRFFDSSGRKSMGHLLLNRGTYSQTAAVSSRPALERVRSSGGVNGVIENMSLVASGLHLTVEEPDPSAGPQDEGRMEGFLFGPVTIRMAAKPEKNDMKTTYHSVTAAALLATAFAAQPDATPPSAGTPAPAAEPTPPPGGLRSILDASEKTTRRVKEYLELEDLMNRATDTQVQRPEPVEFKAGADDTVISCDGGAYFDVKSGVVVFMGNVVVNNPRFDLTGVDKLEAVFVERPKLPKPAKGGKKEAAKDGGQGTEAKPDVRWDLQRLVATGAVRFLEKKEQPVREGDELPIEASGQLFTYEVSGDDRPDTAVLSGGRPWMKRGESGQRAKKQDQSMIFTIARELDKDGKERRAVTRVDTPGGWDAFIVTKELQKGK